MRPRTAVTRRRAPQQSLRSPLTARWLAPLLSLGLLGVIGYGAWTYWNQSLRHAYPIRYVRIEGKILQLDESELSSAISPLAQGGFFDVDLSAIEAVGRSFPWVEDLRVVRQWPDTLIVNVSEHRPAARWNQGSLLNDRGVRFTPASLGGFDALPVLSGPEGQERAVFAVLSKLNAMIQGDDVRVGRLQLTARQSWTATLSDGQEIVIGRQDPVASFERLRRWLPSLERRRGAFVKRVDLRYRNGFAVVWGLATEPEPAPDENGAAGGTGASLQPFMQRPNSHLAALQW
ncbi:cell division protein FtsQ/DivIB [Methylotetracoccus oryzae]|uniref:cell division protein FtsQ/DivIB n=1 Tax=Methylotetracoccus oryzae TaxID=1919059 RepID=UPI00111B4F02|nr:cell division protein FtsQ/DivIB [Methylotetracoccus oryzae]